MPIPVPSALPIPTPSIPPPPHPPPLQNQNHPPNFTKNTPKKIPPPPSWVDTLRSQTRSHDFRGAINTYITMISSGAAAPPDHFTFPAALKSATSLHDLRLGRQLHAAAVKSGYPHSRPITAVSNTLVTMYSKCGDFSGTLKAFDGITDRDQVSWNSIIAALCMFEEWEAALRAFRSMLSEGFEPSSFTLVSVCLACSNFLRLAKQVHCHGLRAGFYCNGEAFVNNALMTMYAKLGRVDDSVKVFEGFDWRDRVSWNTMIGCFSQNDWFEEALAVFRRMVVAGVKPDGFSL